MYKVKTRLEAKENMKKNNLLFVLFPTIALSSDKHGENYRRYYSASFAWLFFVFVIEIEDES